MGGAGRRQWKETRRKAEHHGAEERETGSRKGGQWGQERASQLLLVWTLWADGGDREQANSVLGFGSLV